jgi:hypothetical protein
VTAKSIRAWSRLDPPQGFCPQEGPASPSVRQQQTLEDRGSGVEGGILLAVIPDIGRELPVTSDLLSHHDTFAGDFLRRRSLGLEAEVPIFARRGALRSSGERNAGPRLCRARDESSLHRRRDAVAADRDGGRFERAVLLLVGGGDEDFDAGLLSAGT